MAHTMNEAWLKILRTVLSDGRSVAPRGRKVLELDHQTLAVDMRHPVLTVPRRKLSYRLMAGEAWWILSGSDRLADVLPSNPRMAEFSDNGVTLAGAYGPRFVAQLGYVAAKLREDRDTRQATATLWTPNPAPSKDYPCTVALDFKIRDDLLNLHVFMRSSDVWLGLPYDAFAFAMMACRVAEELNAEYNAGFRGVGLGTLYVTAASSHLYEENIAAAQVIVASPDPERGREVPARYYDPVTRLGGDAATLVQRLAHLKDTKKGDLSRWWEGVI